METIPPTDTDAEATHQQSSDAISEQYDERPASARVVEALALATGTDPLEIEPLYRSVDPDALDALFRTGDAGWVRFTHHGHEVTVHADGHVAVDGTGRSRE